MEEHTIAGKLYFNVNDLKKRYAPFFKGCLTSNRKIIKKKGIKKPDYVYARKSKKSGNWIMAPNQDKPSSNYSTLLSKDWVTANITNKRNVSMPAATAVNYSKNFTTIDRKIEENKMISTEKEAKRDLKEYKKKYPIAPPIIELDDCEKFKDEKGNPLDIETRGERRFDKTYFCSKDIERAFASSWDCRVARPREIPRTTSAKRTYCGSRSLIAAATLSALLLVG